MLVWAFLASEPPFFSCLLDILGTSEMRDKLEKDLLDHLTPDVLEDYGQDYILKQRNYFSSENEYGHTDLTPVLLNIQHAISAKRPFTFYSPGSGAFPWLYFVSFGPTIIFDYFNKKFNFSVSDMPRALRMPNWKNKAM